MSQICKNCGFDDLSDDAVICPECFSELDCLINKKENAKKTELANMGKKSLFFSIFSALAGIVMTLYINVIQLDLGIFTVLVPAIIWLAVSAVGVLYAARSFGSTKKTEGIIALIITAVQLAAIPVFAYAILGL